MVKVKRHNTGADVYNANNAPLHTPKERGQLQKKPREPRHEGPVLAPAVAARVRSAVLADYAARQAAGYVPDPDTGYADVAAQTLNLLDMLGMQIPGYVTVITPNGGGVTHLLREDWDNWQGEIYQAKLRRQRRGDIDRGDTVEPAEMIRLTRTRKADTELLLGGVEYWQRKMRGDLEEDEDE